MVTGAARGIGKAISNLFHIEGATVILTDILDEEGIKVTKSLSVKCQLRVSSPECKT